MPTTIQQMTKYPQGSLRELCAISFPLMLALMSSSLMFFADRLLLAQFSLAAHNAAVSSGAIVSFLQFAFICTTCFAEVFVGQANGAGRYQEIAIPVWQMIWLSFFSLFFFLPVGYFAGDLIFSSSAHKALEIEYFSILMYFGSIFCLNGALSAFYIGRGRVAFITTITIIGNFLNIFLAYFMIFGFPPYFEPMGIAGAAIATGIAQTLQAVVLFIGFMRKKNRKKYGSGNYAFNQEHFFKCLSVGFPSSLAHTIEILAWAVFFQILMASGEEQLTVVAVAQSIFFLFTFITEGVSKAASAIAANLIGSGRENLVWKLLHSGIKFYVVIFIILSIPLVFKPIPLISLFLPDSAEPSSVAIHQLLTSSCLWIWLFFLFDGIHWLVVGLLTAAGDTRFILKIGASAIWFFALLPTYVAIALLGSSADTAWAITALYGVIISSIYLWRFRSRRWQKIVLTN